MKYTIVLLLLVFVFGCEDDPKEYHYEFPNRLVKDDITANGAISLRPVDTMYQDGEYVRIVMHRGTILEDTTSYIGKIGDKEGKILTKEELAFHKTIDSLKYIIKMSFPTELGKNISITFNKDSSITVSTCGGSYGGYKIDSSMNIGSVGGDVIKGDKIINK